MQRVLLANSLTEGGEQVSVVCLKDEGVLRDRVNSATRVSIRNFRLGIAEPTDVILSGSTKTELFFSLVSRFWTRRASRWVVAIHNPMSSDAPTLSTIAVLMMRLADARIALTAQHSQEIARKTQLQCEYIVSNGVDLDDVDDLIRARRSSTAQFTFGFIGRIAIHHKGLDRMIDALKCVQDRDWTLAIAGDGPDMQLLVEHIRINGLQDRIVFVGYLQASDFFRKIHTLLVFSRYEAQPMVLLEASGYGVPVLATAEAGAGQLENAQIAETSETASIGALLGKRLDAIAMGSAPRVVDSAITQTVEDMARAYSRIIDDLAATSIRGIGHSKVRAGKSRRATKWTGRQK